MLILPKIPILHISQTQEILPLANLVLPKNLTDENHGKSPLVYLFIYLF